MNKKPIEQRANEEAAKLRLMKIQVQEENTKAQRQAAWEKRQNAELRRLQA